jgi:protein-tyrosine-phosphatase
MAEAFARTYGSDVIIPASAGLSPAMAVAPDTIRAMAETNIDIRDQFPKGLRHLGRSKFALVINMSGFDVPDSLGEEIRSWDVPDPVFFDYGQHCEVRDAIERLVMTLIAELRRKQNTPDFRPFRSPRLQP